MTAPVHSALYEGTVRHARLDATPHAFTYQVLMAWLDLDELPAALDAHPLWSARRWAPVCFQRRDFHGDPDLPLDTAVRDTVERELGRRPEGPIRLLAHLRTWGWAFNPIAFYFVLSPDGSQVDTLLAEVTNTPWRERHAYVVPVNAPELVEPVRFPKAMHVSPFLDLDLDHSLAFTRPGADHLTIRMDDWRGDHRELAATLSLRRLPLDHRSMARTLRRHPLPAQRVSAGIYREALKLRWKQAPFRHHPQPVGPTRSTSSHPPEPITTTTRSIS
ncbi:DUF1365 domain-containing protein [Aquihabitans sp. McL0605]|uniref:DUF1365 domain-containing protein n=1 Tax=Aquihabitans sp. McL0605 TaxID=3415671 RepID=UPI003CEBA4F0